MAEEVARFLSRRAEQESKPLRDELLALSTDRAEDVRRVYESLPEWTELSDRNEEIGQPLMAVCLVLALGREGSNTDFCRLHTMISSPRTSARNGDSLDWRS